MAKDVRARRADHAREAAKREKARAALGFVPRHWKGLLVTLVLVVAGGAYAAYAVTHAPTAIHEHATFAIFAEGTRVSFRDPAYDFTQGFSAAEHMHSLPGSGDVNDTIHIEGTFPGGVPTWTLKDFFAQYGLIITPTSMKLDTLGGHNGTLYTATANDTLRVFDSIVASGVRQPFALVPGDATKLVPRDEMEILITFGHADATELASEEAHIGTGPWGAP
ncbi:MAG: hypothetical protein ACYDCK_03490 [Thermoplasmatota archaeon]